MKMKRLYIPMLLLSIVLIAAACSGEAAAKPSGQTQPETTQKPAGTDEADVWVEDWPEDMEDQTQTTGGTEQTAPEADKEGSAAPAGKEETPSAPGEAETVPTTGQEETPPATGEEESGTSDAQTSAPGSLSYQDYLALSPEERQAYVESFPTMEEAMAWYEAAKKAYDESQDVIDIGGGSVDLGDIMNGMGE